jgi:hypothetical protein
MGTRRYRILTWVCSTLYSHHHEQRTDSLPCNASLRNLVGVLDPLLRSPTSSPLPGVPSLSITVSAAIVSDAVRRHDQLDARGLDRQSPRAASGCCQAGENRGWTPRPNGSIMDVRGQQELRVPV